LFAKRDVTFQKQFVYDVGVYKMTDMINVSVAVAAVDEAESIKKVNHMMSRLSLTLWLYNSICSNSYDQFGHNSNMP